MSVRLREQARSHRFAVLGVTRAAIRITHEGVDTATEDSGAESLLHLHFRVAVFKHPNHFGGVP